MWKPGDVIFCTHKQAWHVSDMYGKTGIIISVKETGYGTKGHKYNCVILLSSGELEPIVSAETFERYFKVLSEIPETR